MKTELKYWKTVVDGKVSQPPDEIDAALAIENERIIDLLRMRKNRKDEARFLVEDFVPLANEVRRLADTLNWQTQTRLNMKLQKRLARLSLAIDKENPKLARQVNIQHCN
jgi:hypothetical protein